MQNNVVQGVKTESMEHISSGQNNVEHEVETAKFIECNSSGQSQQRASISNLLNIIDAWLIKIVSRVKRIVERDLNSILS